MSNLSVKWIVLFLLIIGVLFLIYLSQHLHRQFKSEALEGLEKTKTLKASIITEEDIAHLPEPVEKYLRYVGVVGKEKIKNFKVTIDGKMKTDRDKDWANVNVEQYSFVNNPTRLFYLKMNMKGIPVIGLHSYKNANAVMLIKLGGLITVVNGEGPEMNKAETVTVFNDMCLLAPGSLIDERITWEPIDSLTTKATFNNEGIKISATLYFNEEGQLINFHSDDRYYSPTGTTFESLRWSTPVSNYKNINGYNLPTYGEALWSFPDEDFSYARFNIKNIEYNVKDFK